MKINAAIIKEHPYATAITVILGGVVFFKIYTAGSDSTQIVSGGQDASTIATQNQMALQGQQISGQLQALGIQAGTQVQLATLDAQTKAMTAAYQYQVAQLQAGYESQHDQISAAVQTAQINAQLAAIQSQQATLINQSQISAQAQIAAINSSVRQSAIQAQQQIATQRAQSDAQVAIAQQQAQAAMYGAKVNASVAKSGQTMSLIGTLGMAAAMFFCDVQIKTSLGCVSTGACLAAVRNIPLDRFVYLMDSAPSVLGDNREHLQTYSQAFYKELGITDWYNRNRIDVMDMMGAILGSIKELESKNDN